MKTAINLFYYLYLLSVIFHKGLSLRGRVCTTNSSTIRCCIHFYEDAAGDCQECPIGSTSDGLECRPCPDSYYGRRCATKCYCSAKQVCDPVGGCVIASETRTIKIPGRDIVSRSGPVPSTTLDITTSTSFQTSNDSKTVYFIALGGVLVIAVLLSMFLHTVRKKCKKRKVIDDVKEPTEESPYGVSYLTTGYHYLDESKMVDHVNKNALDSLVNIKNIDTDKAKPDALNLNRKLNETTSRDSYLNPYQPMKTAVDVHEYNGCVKSDDTESASKDEYLNPYNPLLKNQNQDDHNYLKCKAVNDQTSTFRSSISDRPENDYTSSLHLDSNSEYIKMEKEDMI